MPAVRSSCRTAGEGLGRTARVFVSEESHRGIVPMKHSNNDGTLSAESAEGRLRLKENALSLDTYPTQSGTARVLRVGECADRMLAAIYPREEPDALMSARPDLCGGHRATGVPTAIASDDGTLSRMTDQRASVLQFLKGQEICQIAFGIYDLQINWGNGGLTCTGRLRYEPADGTAAIWTEGHPWDAVPLLRLLKQTISAFDRPSEGELALLFSNGDRLAITPEDGFESFTINHKDKPIIVGR